MPLPELPTLAADDLVGQRGVPYLAEPGLLAATNAALALGAPLLLTGEAGCGKTDFAFAAASGLTRWSGGEDEPLACYVRSDTRARDLLYHYDAVTRFGDAQLAGAGANAWVQAHLKSNPDVDPQAIDALLERSMGRARDPRNYIRLEGLGEALVSPHLRVVLVDEIDKAQRDLPNDLLRELDQGWFEIPEISPDAALPKDKGGGPLPIALADRRTWRRKMRLEHSADHEKTLRRMMPLVLITSNVERQLPDAFLRRCVFYHLSFPSPEKLVEILDVHAQRFTAARGETLEVAELQRVVTVFMGLRVAEPRLTKRPATAELIGWVQSEMMRGRWRELQRSLSQHLSPTLAGWEEREREGWPARSDRAPDWSRLRERGLSNLVKLKEDLRRVLAAAPAGPPDEGALFDVPGA